MRLIKSNSIAFFILLGLIKFQSSYGQNFLLKDSLTTGKHFNISLFSNVTAKSNAFPNSFYTEFYRGGYLSDEVKHQAADKLKNLNRFGADAEAGVIFRQSIDSIFRQSGWAYTFKIAERRHLNLEMSRDFFNVGFFGNAMYENRMAQLAKFQLDFISYQQIGLGLERTLKIKDDIHHLGIMANYLNGRNAQRARIDNAELFTATDGEFLTLDFSGNYHRTDSVKSRQLIADPAKGGGFSIDAYYQLKTKEHHELQISILDFGYIYWKKSALTYQYDTMFTFEGIDIPNLISINDSLIKLSTDSLKEIAKRSTEGAFKTSLPTWLQMSYSHCIIPEKLMINFYGRYRFNDIYMPFIAVGGTYIHKNFFSVSGAIGYGGYGNFNYSLMFNQRVWKYISISVGSQQLEGLLMPKKANGQSIVFSLKSWF